MYKIFNHKDNIEIVDNRSYIFISKEQLKRFIEELNKIEVDKV